MINAHHKLISILGTTATGKTDLALFLANKIIQEKLAKGVNLISADSRQIYQGLEILTGADIPQDFIIKKNTAQNYKFAQHQTLPIKLHGVSIIQPDEEWSVAHFRNMAIKLIQQSWQDNELPIIVGGTSFYHKQLFNNDPDIYLKPNLKIRQELENLSIKELQQKLKVIDPKRITQMNNSDYNNPRRLIRAIEVALTKTNLPLTVKNRPIFHQPQDYFSIALHIDLKTLEKKIKLRVNKRLNQNAIDEVKKLITLNLPATAPVMTTLGVEPITQYLHQKIDKQQAIENWTLAEFQYAKRQITWIKQLSVNLSLKPSINDFQNIVWQKTTNTIFNS